MRSKFLKKLLAGVTTFAMAAQLAAVIPASAAVETLVDTDGSTALFKDYSRTTVEVIQGDGVNTGSFERIAMTGNGSQAGAGYTFADAEQTESAVVTVSFDAKLGGRPRLSLRADTPGTGNRNDDATSRVFTLGQTGAHGVVLEPHGNISSDVVLGEWKHYEFVVDCLNRETSFKIYNYVDGQSDYSGDEVLISADNVAFRDSNVSSVTAFDFYGSYYNASVDATSYVCIDNLKVTSETPDMTIYTLTYIVDGQTTTENVVENAMPQSVPSPSKTGYIFKGWQVGDDTGNIISTETLESTPVTASVTYTAVFEEDPNYIEEMASVEFSTLPSGYMLVAGPDSETAASNLIDVEITGELGTDLAANPDPRVEDFDVTYEIKGFNWKSNEQAPTADSAEWGYCDTYGRVVETSETGIDFQIKNHVFNYYGQVVATVTYNEKTKSISAPLAFIGDSAANTNNLQILPRGGYYEDFDAYSPDMVGYEAATSSNNSSATDVVTDNWASYGSNGARSVKIAEEEGNRFMRLEVTENAGNSAFAVNQIDAVTDSQIVIDQMVRFYAAESEIMLKTANPVTWNNDATTFTLKFTGSAVTLNGVDMQATVTTGEWYRILVTSDVTSGKCYAEIYSESGELLGASEVVNFENAGSTNPTYYMFRTPDRTVTMIDFDKVKITRAVIDAETLNTTTTNQTIAIPEAGQEAVIETVTVSANTTDGLPAIGLATWSIGDAMIDGVTVTPSAEDSHVATVTVEAGATPGNLPINVLIGGSMATINLTLSSTQDSVQFTDSSSSISIPLSEAQTVVQPYTAAVVDGDGNEIEGKEITYALYDANNTNPIDAPEGTTFENGVLTVTSAAKACVVYVRAISTNSAGEVISKAVRVDIHGLTFDFGAGTEEDVVEGYTSVTPSTIYSEASGYGIEGTAEAGGEASLTDATTDYLSGSFTFKANVEANKIYSVSMNYAGTAAFENINSELTGVVRSNAEKSTVTYLAYVHDDGVLDISFSDAQVSAVEVTKVDDKEPNVKPNIFSVGDSTIARNGAWAHRLYYDIESYPELADIATFSNNGRSSRTIATYYSEGILWDSIITNIRPGDYVMVGSLGTNGGATPLFKDDINYYIDACLAMGAKVILNSYSPHGAVEGYSGNYDPETHTFTGWRKDPYDVIVREVYEERQSELAGFVEIGKNADAAFNAYVADCAANGHESADEAAQAIISCFTDHNHYSGLAATLMLDGYGDVKGIVAQLVDILSTPDEPVETGASASYDGTTATVQFKNLDGASAVIYVAEYADDNTLKAVKKSEVTVSGADATETVSYTAENADNVKVFVWTDRQAKIPEL